MFDTLGTAALRLVHPVTGHFIAEWEPATGRLLVVDRGHTVVFRLYEHPWCGTVGPRDDIPF